MALLNTDGQIRIPISKFGLKILIEAAAVLDSGCVLTTSRADGWRFEERLLEQQKNPERK